MSLQIPHREKANGTQAATKAVILVCIIGKLFKGGKTDLNRLEALQEEQDFAHCR